MLAIGVIKSMVSLGLQKSNRGFTLIELMVVVTILAVLVTVAVPSFQQYQASQAVRSAAADLVSAMNFARSEAVKRNANVVVSANETWNGGWLVKLGTTTLRKFSAHASVEVDSDVTSLTYSGNGRAGAAADFEVESSVGNVSPRCVRVSGSGKPNNRVGECP